MGLSAMVRWLADMVRTDSSMAELEAVIDVESFVAFATGNLLVSHWDGYMNNWYLYQDVEGDGRWSIVPVNAPQAV